MQLMRLERLVEGADWTEGFLTWEGGQCYTLERAEPLRIKAWTYSVKLRESLKFKSREWCAKVGGVCPEICEVRWRSGILIHVGNTARDTTGCVLVGKERQEGTGVITRSAEAFDELVRWIRTKEEGGSQVYIKIFDIQDK